MRKKGPQLVTPITAPQINAVMVRPEPHHVVYLMDDIRATTTPGMIRDMRKMINSIPYRIHGPVTACKRHDPVPVDNTVPVIDIFINSDGPGDIERTKKILNLIYHAQYRGIVVRTILLKAGVNSTSQIAAAGTPGFRIMCEPAFHKIDSAQAIDSTSATNSNGNMSRELQKLDRVYLNSTFLGQNELRRFRDTSSGEIISYDCLERGLCDWVINIHGFGNRQDLSR